MDEKKRLLVASSSSSSGAMEKQETPPPPPVQLGQKCPRCDSSNTKFCYYNNYSLSQPRHFCKGCKRYWTRGGTLRNVPVGGGCRKNKRLKIIRPPPVSVTTTTVVAAAARDHHQLIASTNNHIASPMLFSGVNYTTASRVSTSRSLVGNILPDLEEAAAGRGLGFSSAAQLLPNGHDFLNSYYSSSAMNSLLTIEDKKYIISTGGDQLKDDSSGLAAMNKLVQGHINYNYPLGNGNGNNYLGYQMEQQVIGSSTTDPANYYWSMSNNANIASSNNWLDHPPPPNTHESPVPSFI